MSKGLKFNLKKLLIVIVGLLLSTNALALVFEVNGIRYFVTDSYHKTVTVTAKSSNAILNNYNGNIRIPSKVTYIGTTYSVTSISEYAFEGCSRLTSVTIPNSVTKIKKRAFWGCKGLTSVTIPNSVTEIDYEAFFYCSNLTSVTIGNSVKYIGYETFKNCNKLKEVNISNLSAWCKIVFGDVYANPLAFGGKLKLNGSEVIKLVIPNNITKINDHTFSGYTGLTSVTIPNSVTHIGKKRIFRLY